MLKLTMRKILLISSFIFCTFLSATVPIIKAQTYSSSAPVVATPIATPLIILTSTTPLVIPAKTPAASSSAVKPPVTGATDYTYLFLLVGLSACIFALYRLKCRK